MIAVPGYLILEGMGIQIPVGGLVLTVGEDGVPAGEITAVRLRLDLWPNWLEIGCRATDQAIEASQGLTPEASDSVKTAALGAELEGGLVAVAAFAFSIDGFYDTVRNELGEHPDQAAWKKKRTARAAQVTETLRYHLKLGPKFSTQMRKLIDEVFGFRGRAVHPNGAWVAPNYRPEIDSGVHPHLLTFSGPHARHCRALTLVLLDQLLSQAAKVRSDDADSGWIDRGRKEVDRMMAAYRTAGDDRPAFPTVVPDVPI